MSFRKLIDLNRKRCVIPKPDITCGFSLLLVLSLTPRIFLQALRFSFFNKNQLSKFQFEWETVDKRSHLLECPLLNSIYLFQFIYLFKGK